MSYLGPSLRRVKRVERPVRRALLAALASLALNAAILWALAAAGAFQMTGPADQTRVALAPLSAEQWAANRAVAGARPKAPAPEHQEPQKPREEDPKDGTVVELSPDQQASDQPPENSRNLADRNTRVERETVSRDAGRKYPRNATRVEPGVEGKTDPVVPPWPKPHPRVQRGGNDAGVPGREGAPGERVATARPSGALRLPELGEGGERGHGAQQQTPDLSVSSDALARIAGGPAPNYLPGVDEGETTQLNAKSFRFATFFNRVAGAVYREWDPVAPYRARDPDGTVFPIKDRTTIVELVMDESGRLENVGVRQPSGLDFLDRELVRAARAAAPFPNPPRGMLEQDGKIHVGLAFTLQLTRGNQAAFHVILPSGPGRSQQPYPETLPK